MSKTYSKTRILVECALMIAIGTVLSNIKFFTLPNGDHQGALHKNAGLGIGF